ncbi:MAG: pyridoxal 5'-phosphate synthase glutaminase subunit PdxT [Alphaproteobacteria bacterium]|nr:pyridoxal 5'-phosphate synthase glutaminase subunit PdxT [Alphaproteobacteria bacterium]
MSHPVIGVLALQGCVEPHRPHIEAAGAEFAAVKTPQQFDAVDAFILPGGESTTMLKLIDMYGLWDSLTRNFKTKPVWGICAGTILMAQHVTNPQQKSFGLLPISVQRNAYGRQLDSHHGMIDNYLVSFIRAPVILSPSGVGISGEAEFEILATHESAPVWVRQGPYMATTFHPELTQDFPSPMHRTFVDLVRGSAAQLVA